MKTLEQQSIIERQVQHQTLQHSKRALEIQGWITSSTTLNTAGNYKFVFIGGTFDRTGFLYSGNGLKLRNVDVQAANPPPQNELEAKVTVQAVESNQVRIGSNLLTSAQTSVSK